MKSMSDRFVPGALRVATSRGAANGFASFDLGAGVAATPRPPARTGEGLPFAAIGESSGFRLDARYFRATSVADVPSACEAEPAEDDTVAIAYAEGFEAGAAEAMARAEEAARVDAEAREALRLSFARMDAELEESLRQRLLDTVSALCEAAVAPLALDKDLLVRRIERAVSMLARADDERVIRLNPADLELVSPQLSAEWTVIPDPSLERGALRVECESGGVADGPEAWRQAIAEALHQC